ncbi:putative NlpC/P60-like cell-wall peptidase [Aspergillus lucknowensis]|uniref:NlpC/P60-like cell-wall peptidase n=1 Tax=Aspergillus lucknowensis TaxID=176173 RepID=A0ABR4M003_9EURO
MLASFTLALAAMASVASAGYPIKADDVNCRAGPSTDDDVVTTYSEGTEVDLQCQTFGESVMGTNIWDKTTDDCYVIDYYVKTGTVGMVTDDCNGGSNGTSEYQGEITREEIISRGQFWVAAHVPYSMTGSYPDPQGRSYRTDCSGYVSMALHAWAPGYNTVSLPEVAEAIEWEDLQPGDFVGTLGDGTANAAGHVTLFYSWTDDDHTEYNTLECQGGNGCVTDVREVGWGVGDFTAKPYRYTRLKE